MRWCLVVGLALLLFACDTVIEHFDLTGEWDPRPAGKAVSGACCDLYMNLTDEGGQISGNGEIHYPGGSSGGWYETRFEITGTYTPPTLRLTLKSGLSEGQLEGQVYPDSSLAGKIEGRFEGFGFDLDVEMIRLYQQ